MPRQRSQAARSRSIGGSPPIRIRDYAVGLLARCASGQGETLREIAEAQNDEVRPEGISLARAAIVASLGVGTWREVRAEAECKLREGWHP